MSFSNLAAFMVVQSFEQKILNGDAIVSRKVRHQSNFFTIAGINNTFRAYLRIPFLRSAAVCFAKHKQAEQTSCLLIIAVACVRDGVPVVLPNKTEAQPAALRAL